MVNDAVELLNAIRVRHGETPALAPESPRSARRARSSSEVSSIPSKRMGPSTIRPGGRTRPITLRKVALLPEPDSPTTPRHFPRQHVEIDPVDRTDGPAVGVELGPQARDR